MVGACGKYCCTVVLDIDDRHWMTTDCQELLLSGINFEGPLDYFSLKSDHFRNGLVRIAFQGAI